MGVKLKCTQSDKKLLELKNFKDTGDPFTEEFFKIFESVYRQHLQTRKNKLDKKLESIHAWRKVSTVIFAATFAAVLICSVVAAAMAAPPMAAALVAASSIPLVLMGRWIDSLLKNYENAMREQKLVVFTNNIEELEAQTDDDNCSRDICTARTVILQRIIKHPNN